MNGLIEFTERFGNMMSRGLLTLLYFFVLGPFALLFRMFADPLHLRPRKDGNWTAWQTSPDTLQRARKQD